MARHALQEHRVDVALVAGLHRPEHVVRAKKVDVLVDQDHDLQIAIDGQCGQPGQATAESGREPGRALNTLPKEGSELPAAGVYSTVSDVFRFVEMLRLGGALDGTRILSPLTIDLATRIHTGDKPNDLWAFAREARGWDEFPANLGLGFFVRGEGLHPVPHGTLASPRSFGHIGAGSTVFWVDPVREVSFICLTAGLLDETHSLQRWQRLSDMALSAVVK